MVADVHVNGVTVRYGGRPVVEDVSMRFVGGRIHGLLGPNGCGKSTLLRVMSGLIRPDVGECRIGVKRYAELRHPFAGGGVWVDGCGIHPSLTGRQHLVWVSRASGVPRRRVEEMLELFALTEAADSKVGSYSLGMRQRLGLAGCLISGQPEFLILDEPFNGLDADGVRLVGELMKEVKGRGGVVVVATHHLGEMQGIADEVTVMVEGRIVRQLDLDELERGEGVRLRAVLQGSEAGVHAFVTKLPGQVARIRQASAGSWTVRLLFDDVSTVASLAADSGVVLRSVERGEALTDVYQDLLSASAGGNDR